MTAKFRKLFDAFDKDHSGSIDVEELTAGLRVIGCNPTVAEIQTILKEADDNGNGQLEFDEFCYVMSRYQKSAEDVETDLLEAFMFFDKDGDGSISREEMTAVLTKRGLEKTTDVEAEKLFAEADTDKNGLISYRELVQIIHRM
jgi:Ca2+-binding EF-hand superfamily protein